MSDHPESSPDATDPAPRLHQPYPALGADGVDVAWRTWDDDHAEALAIRWDNEAWTAVGDVERESIQYVLRLSSQWRVSQFLLFRDMDEPDLWLGTDGRGRWGEVNGSHRPELEGCVDIELGCTPFTLSLPIRRRPIAAGASFEVAVVAVDVDTLDVQPARRHFARLGSHRWRVEPVAGPDWAEFEPVEFFVDTHGLPADIPNRFRRT